MTRLPVYYEPGQTYCIPLQNLAISRKRQDQKGIKLTGNKIKRALQSEAFEWFCVDKVLKYSGLGRLWVRESGGCLPLIHASDIGYVFYIFYLLCLSA